ncbi:putative competence-damage inducible protein [Paenibacillus sp. J31TS4]|uniref:competence/damage-inducible protein A n=1 Tax=Paenibacillus sp. J31TS4 TaxID=2807195 RepID=UPI001B10A5E5|nr:competence/damage-inducible protein A [Paenibacillus sp. J31TS4]GIP36887.1 putative competence-damage inducible protein [Paenibacillus sp. J31TS4]
MKAEIIAVGTELLLGQIVNTNAQFLAGQCAAMGVHVYFQTVVGDNAERLTQSLEIARGRADVVICTGGLGPTQDDMTKDVLAAYTGRGLVMHEPSLAYMTSLFQSRGTPMVESNKRQALMLEGSDPLPNDTGLAVGVALTHEGTHYLLLPGPPKEMKPMFERYGSQWLASQMGSGGRLYSRMLKFAGIGESALEAKLLDLIEGQNDPTIAPYAKEGEVTIRLTTQANDKQEADGKLDPTQQEIASRLGEYLYADEEIPIEQTIYRLLKERGETLAFAESCTGGLLSDLLTNVPDSSSVLAGGIVSYTNAVKHAMLGVPMELLEGEDAPGAVSEETARAMAEGVLSRLGTDYGVSVTGVAGPSPSEGKPVGLVYLGLAQRGRETVVIKTQQWGNRESVKWKSAKAALYHLWRRLAEQAN